MRSGIGGIGGGGGDEEDGVLVVFELGEDLDCDLVDFGEDCLGGGRKGGIGG